MLLCLLLASLPFLQEEKHIQNLRQLSFGGENAEAYPSFEEDRIAFQTTRTDFQCDQIFLMDFEGKNLRLVSTGKGRTTCSYFFPGGKRLLYASTHQDGDDCPPRPDYSKGYVWALYNYDIYTVGDDGKDLKTLFATPGYDAEATISPDGKTIVFTSTKDGDLDLYSMNLDGSGLRRLTNEIGYDGGAFFSPDSKRIVYRAFHPKEEKEIAEYKELLAQNLVRPSVMELFVMDADGANRRQITQNGAANFAPYWHPDGKRIVFASNLHNPRGRDFDLYLVRDDGSNLERVTFNPTFDGFPVFTKDGKRLIFSSNRNGKERGETNVFVADWVDVE